ncbi:MAG: AsmA-like C-terminal region-containing protein, partial [Pseudomonadota bacterium]
IAVDRLRAGPVEGETVSLNADYGDDRLTVDALIVEDFGGMEVFASGAIATLSGDPVGSIEGTVTVRSGAALANVIETLFPQGPRTDVAVAMARHLAPGTVNVALAGEPAGEEEPGRSRLNLTANGMLGGTDIALSANGVPATAGWADRPVNLTLTARNDGAATLLRQLGIGGTIVPGGLAGDGAVRLAIDGTPADGLSLSAAAEFAGTSLAVDGTAQHASGWSFDGSVNLDAPDLAPLAAALGQAGAPRTSVRLGGTLSTAPDRLSMAELSGAIGGADVSGSLAFVGDTVTGLVEADAVSLGALASLVLATGATPDGASDGWPTTPFAAPLTLPVSLDVSVQTRRLDVGRHVLRDAAFALSLTPDTLALTDGTARLSGGRVTGALRLDRDGTLADVRGEFGLEGAALGDLVWRDGQRPVARGRLDLSAQFAASGRTLAGLVADLSGEGVARLADARILGLNPAPFDPAISLPASPAGEGDATPTQVEEDDTRAAFAAHMADGDWAVADVSIPFQIDAGRVTVEEVALQEGETALRASARLDIEAWQLESDWVLTAPAGEEAITVGLVFRGPLEAPARWIDVAPLTAWINLTRLEQQIRAVEAENDALAAEADAIDAALTPREDATADDPGVDEDPAASPEAPAGAAPTQEAPTQAAPTLEAVEGPEDDAAPPQTSSSPEPPAALTPNEGPPPEAVLPESTPPPRRRPDEAAAAPSPSETAAGSPSREETSGPDPIAAGADPAPSRAEQFRVHLEDVDRAVLTLRRRQQEQDAARADLMRRLGIAIRPTREPAAQTSPAPSAPDDSAERLAPFRVLPEDLLVPNP